MKIGASTLCFFQECFDSLLMKLPKTGINVWEIADDGFHSLDQDRVRMLNEIHESYGILFNVHTPWTSVNISAMHPNVRGKMQQTVMDSLSLAHDLGSEYAVIHPGVSSFFVEGVDELCWRYTAEFLERACLFCEDNGVKPLVENIFPPYFLFYDTDHIDRYFHEDAPGNLRLVCDFAHANICGNLLPLLEKVAEYVGYVHLSGNHGEKDEHLPIDEGNVNWRQGLDLLLKVGFDAPIIMENRSLDDVKKSLESLNSFIQ